MNKLRILHITPWFPNPKNEVEGVFIAAHLKALSAHCQNTILHLKFDTNFKEQFQGEYEGMKLKRIVAKPMIDKWRVKELLAKRTLKKYLDSHVKDYDIVNFYIAYPNAVHIDYFQKRYPDIKFTISEQWSAYHENFNLPEENKGRQRIASLFHNNAPLFVVSNALGKDIQRFSGLPSLPYEVVPNIADTANFKHSEKTTEDPFIFCSINNWSSLKNPFVLIRAFKTHINTYSNSQLILAGSGNLTDQMQALVNELNLQDKVVLTGRLTKEEVVNTLHKANVYCQSSNYETFSAICIEALATGTPVLATNIGGMKDFVNNTNGQLVDDLSPELWAKAMGNVRDRYDQFDKKSISEQISETYNAAKVGQLYAEKFKEVIADAR